MKTCAILGTSYFSSKEHVKIRKNMEEIGFKNLDYFTSNHHYFDKWAGTPEERIELFYRAWNSASDAIFALKGGSGVSHFVNRLNPKKLLGKKLFVGYSDLTIILNFLHEKKNMISLHGPMSTAELDYLSSFYLKKALSMEDYSLNFVLKDVLNAPKVSNIEGELVGGNLTRFLESLHYFDIDMRDKILFLEEVNETEAKILNNLFILSSYKYFKPKAIVFGDMGTKLSLDFDSEVKNLFKDIPLIFNMPFGHSLPNTTIPLGANGKLDFFNQKLFIHFPDSEKDYAVKFEETMPSTPESFRYFFKHSNKLRRLFSIPKKQKSIDEVLKNYKPRNIIKSKKLTIDENLHAVNLSNKIKMDKNVYFFIESYKRKSNSCRLFVKKKNELVPASPWKYHIRRPVAEKIKGNYIIGGETNRGYSLYRMVDVGILKNINTFSHDVEDILLKENKGKIEVFVKYRGAIHWLRTNSLDELNEKAISKSRKLYKFPENNSFNISQCFVLKNNLLGVMGIITKYIKNGAHYFSYPFVFCFDPVEKKVSSTRIILKRSELPETGSLFSNRYNLVSPASLIRGKNKSVLYVTLGQSYVYRLVIKDPFNYYERKF